MQREGDGEGVEITKVIKDSVAETAGLKAGDLVLAIDDEPIEKRRDLVRRIRRDAGKTINLKVRRVDQEIDFSIELKNKP
jgi:C-terminal processing protease CtpA/Prc